MCDHEPRCPAATTNERLAAQVRTPHPEQGWNLLCNGVVVFDDDGALLPTGEALAPPRVRCDPTPRKLVGVSTVGCRRPAEMLRV